MSLSDEIKDAINDWIIPCDLHCPECGKLIDVIPDKSDWNRVVIQILQAVTDKLNE